MSPMTDGARPLPGHKALLIGAADYDEDSIRSLPFIRDDLQQMQSALSERGFQSVEISESRRGVTPNTVRHDVLKFLREAHPGDILFVLLSGHGMHFEGKDYLVPEDARYEGMSFADSCIEIGWEKELEDTAARQVVFLIDACREGASRKVKGVADVPGWDRRKIAAALRRKVAYIYACSTGQYALYVDESETAQTDVGTQPKEEFSLFSRAVSDVVRNVRHALDLAEFERHLQQRVTALHQAYGKKQPVQQLKVRTDIPWADFTALPGPPKETAQHPWVSGTIQSHVWNHTEQGEARETLKEVCAALAARLAEGYDKAAASLRNDPWHDSEFAKRAQARTGFLASQLAEGTRLAPSEAALLVLLPLVGQAFWAHEAAQRAGVFMAVLAESAEGTQSTQSTEAGKSPDRNRFGKFAQGFPRLQRRLRSLEQRRVTDGSAENIRWWLFHRWLIRQPEIYVSPALKALLGPLPGGPDCPEWVADVLSESRFMRLLKELRSTPFALPRRPGQDEHDFIAASTGDEIEIRESRVGALAKAAHALAVDPMDLPEILVEHIGISDSLDVGLLLTTLRESHWRMSGMGRSLYAVCDHPAVQIALRLHADRVDALLRDINRSAHPALAPLRSLPPYADADLVRLSGNTPEHLSEGIRFQLAEDRVQELLMGEELYGERELAIRELYQNALDAVRYRDRRTEYLRRTGEAVAARWRGGLIEFVQKTNEQGRPYLECRDNGVGMGIDELSNVFSQGGVRFVDLPDYVQEQTDWAEAGEPRIELHPNSRFGIGVLSYFMLADEIEVTTCRMGLDGRPGRRLQVKIAGPGNLFRIEDLGPGEDSGTTVRLMLTDHKERVSCVDTLEKVLWLAPYRTTAEHGSRRHEWKPGELSTSGPELAWLKDSDMFSLSGASYPSDDPDVWWLDGTGWFLVDGLLTEGPSYDEPYGVLVNFSGGNQPDLSVDRKKIRKVDDEYVRARLHRAVPSLFSTALPLLTPNWLTQVSVVAVDFADAIAEHARELGVSWPVGEDERSFAEVGFFRPDTALLPLVTGRYPAGADSLAAAMIRTVPVPVLRWRLLTLYRAGLGAPPTGVVPSAEELPCARPSDLVLVSTEYHSASRRWDDKTKDWLAGRDGTGHAFRHPSSFLSQSGAPSLGVAFRWRDPGCPVTRGEVLGLVARTGLTAGTIAERLVALGYDVESVAGSEQVCREDLGLLLPIGYDRSMFDEDPTMLVPEAGIVLSRAQICYSAANATGDLSEARAADRMRQLGFTIAEEPYPTSVWSPEQREVFQCLWSAHVKPVPADQALRITRAQLISVARASGATVEAASRLLRESGFVLSTDEASERELDRRDDEWQLLSYRGVALNVDVDVPALHLAGVAYQTGQPMEEIATRLRLFGFTVPDVGEGEPPSKQDVYFLCQRHSAYADTAWPRRGTPLALHAVALRANEVGSSLVEAGERLNSLGYDCVVEEPLLRKFTNSDMDWVRFSLEAPDRFGAVSPALLWAVADHVERPPASVAESLTDLGYEVEAVPDTWLREREAEAVLVARLEHGPEDSDGQATDSVPAGDALSLTSLAAVAMRLRLPFHVVAAQATALGLTHEAETWFAAQDTGPGPLLILPVISESSELAGSGEP